MSSRDALLLIPAVVSAVVAWVLGRFAKRESLLRHSVSAAIGAGFCAGFFLLYEWPNVLPSRHFHWMLYVAIAGGLLGPVIAAQGVVAWERTLASIVICGAAACALVPTWEDLSPARTVWVPALAAYLALLTIFVEPLVIRLSARVVLLSMFASSFLLAGLLAGIWSVTLGMLAALPALTILGVGLVTWFRPGVPAMRGAVLISGLLAGGAAFVGCVHPPPPTPAIWALLAVPAAPLAMWLGVAGPLSRPLPRKLLCGGVLLTAIYLAAISGWIVIMHGAPTEEY